MNKKKLNHEKLDILQKNIMLPGGVEKYSDFQQYYIREAAKSYMGLSSDFDRDGHSNIKVRENAEKVLESFDLLDDENIFHETSKLYDTILDGLEDEDINNLETNENFIKALSFIKEANSYLNKIKEEFLSDEENVKEWIDNIKITK